MKILSFLIFVLVFINSTTSAQTNPCDVTAESIKFSEIGVAEEIVFKEHVYDFLIKMKAERDSRGYIFNYGSERDVEYREKIAKNMIVFRQYDAVRITFVQAGYAEFPKTEFWIVPPGAILPIPGENGAVIKQIADGNSRVIPRGSVNSPGCQPIVRLVKLGMFEAFGKVSDRYFNWVFGDFAEILHADQTLKGYVLIYGSGEEISDAKDRIVRLPSVQSVNVERLIIMEGGSKKEFSTELWIIPEDTQPPKP